MPDAKIFLLGNDKVNLVPMNETAYIKEEELQLLLARYSDLLPGDQIEPEQPRRWLFVGREVGVPGGHGESDWWSLDHLFLDQDGIPTFVECKRSSDTRARREVVAQMLDYAANGTAYWSADRLRQIATESADKQGKALDKLVRDLTGASEDEDIERFWQTVEENLRRGQVRLIFVADQTPRELLRLTEFLNEQMRDTEVLLVEIKQFCAQDGQKAIVPRLLGRPERTRRVSTPQRATDREEFLSACDPGVRPFFERVLDETPARGYVISFGTVGLSVRCQPPGSDKLRTFVYCLPPNEFQFYFD
jgi:hypothetical protein